MRRLNSVLAITLLVVGTIGDRASTAADGFPRALPEELGLVKEKLARVDVLFQDAVDRKQIAGAVALVVRHGKVAYFCTKGMQDAEAAIAMRPDTIFRIASMTKPITSAG